MFYEDIRTKQDLSYISICLLSILYNSKFILMATSLETNFVVVTRVHCTQMTDVYISLGWCVPNVSQNSYFLRLYLICVTIKKDNSCLSRFQLSVLSKLTCGRGLWPLSGNFWFRRYWFAPFFGKELDRILCLRRHWPQRCYLHSLIGTFSWSNPVLILSDQFSVDKSGNTENCPLLIRILLTPSFLDV